MSRDLTPEQMLIVEKNGTPIIEFMKGLSWVQDGKKTPMYSKEYIELCEKFTYLGKLFDRFPGLYREACKYQAGEDILKGIEENLKEFIENGKGDRDSFVIKWFHGELDKSFYYRERNDEMFHEKVLEMVKEKDMDNSILNASSVIDFDKLSFHDFDNTEVPLQIFFNYDLPEERKNVLVASWGYEDKCKNIELCLDVYSNKNCCLEAVLTFDEDKQHWIDVLESVSSIEKFVGILEKTDNDRAKEVLGLLVEIQNERNIKLYGGMTGEFEVFRTNAPDDIIIEQICKNNQMQENDECIENPYEVIESHGYSVDVIGCQDDDEIMEKITIDKEFDLYDYEPIDEKTKKSLEEKITKAAERITTEDGTSKNKKEIERD